MNIFVSHSAGDMAAAEQLVSSLRVLGQTVTNTAQLPDGPRTSSEHVADAINAADVVVLLLSRATDERFTTLVLKAVTADLDQRGITCIPTLVQAATRFRAAWSTTCVDLLGDYEQDVDHFARNVVAAAALDFSRLDWKAFEVTVARLLERLGFSIEPDPPEPLWCDFVARYPAPDPFGSMREELWFVEAKHRTQQRLGVAELGKLLVQAATTPQPCNALLVTDSLLTSVAREYVTATSRKLRQQIRVIERAELIRLLLRFPDLLEQLPHATKEPVG